MLCTLMPSAIKEGRYKLTTYVYWRYFHMRENEKIPIWEKANLTIREASEYFNIGINKIDEMLKSPTCNFVLYIGNKKLVKRKALEEYLSKKTEL